MLPSLAPTLADQQPRLAPRRVGRTARLVWGSLYVRLGLLVAIFAAVPLILYEPFRAADETKQALLLSTIRERGLLISRALAPVLAQADATPYYRLGEAMKPFVLGSIVLKLLYRPDDSPDPLGFFYVAAAPSASPENLAIERRQLVDAGILRRIAESCGGDVPTALRVELPGNVSELVTSITPVRTSGGCWALVASNVLESASDRKLGLPYWQLPEVQLAAAVYLALALAVLALFFGVFSSLLRFRNNARAIREKGHDTRFAERTEIPELRRVAAEFDSMVDTLRRSAELIREAAEETAHAFKTPLGIIRQAVTSLRRRHDGDAGSREVRALDAIDTAVERLDALVVAARRAERATADALNPTRERVDLSALCRGLAAAYGQDGARVRVDIADDVAVTGRSEGIETAIENVVDNALSFSPVDRPVRIAVGARENRAIVRIEDDGPGVPAADLERIFERSYTQRIEDGVDGAAHFGLGLWVARRNVESIGGTLKAQNRPGGGLAMEIALPLAG